MFGQDWIERFLIAAVIELKKCLLYDLVRFSVAEKVIYPTSFGVPRYDNSDPTSPAVSILFQDVELRMQSRKMKVLPHERIDNDFWSREDFWARQMASWFQGYQQEILGDLFNAAQSTGGVRTTKSELFKEIERQSAVIHKRTMAGPANKILVGSELAEDLCLTCDNYDPSRSEIYCAGRLDERWDVYIDTEFPKNALLLWRFAQPTGHAGFIAAFYHFGLYGHLSARSRSGKLLTRPEFFTALDVSDVV
jgi:hypothetical protein